MKEAWARYKALIQESYEHEIKADKYLGIARLHRININRTLNDYNESIDEEFCHLMYAKYYKKCHFIRYKATNNLIEDIRRIYGENAEVQWEGTTLIINGKDEYK